MEQNIHIIGRKREKEAAKLDHEPLTAKLLIKHVLPSQPGGKETKSFFFFLHLTSCNNNQMHCAGACVPVVDLHIDIMSFQSVFRDIF